jgi:desulfoferrodoxin-like iron-binding protein
MEPRDVLPVYRCEICGSEVAVLRCEQGSLELFCCNQPMARREAPVPEAA